MKKNIEYISLDPSMAAWLLKHLPGGEFRDGIEHLLNEDCSTLMVEYEPKGHLIDYSFQIVCGELVIDERARRITRSGEEISLTPKEFDILLFLAKNRGEVFTKEQIYQAVWKNEYIMDDSNIMAFIRKIRKKIEPNPDAPVYILTIWGIGYKFNDTLE